MDLKKKQSKFLKVNLGISCMFKVITKHELAATHSVGLNYITRKKKKKPYSLGNFQNSLAQPKYTDLE